MKQWAFFWLNGKREVLEGESASDALNRAGYGRGALAALDFFASADEQGWEWDAEGRTWRKVEEVGE